MARLKTRWNKKNKLRHCDETGGAIAISMWKLVAESLLNLENEGFETQTNAQRLDAIEEFLAYSVHLIDRLADVHLDEERRRQFVVAVVRRIGEIVRDNRFDVGDKDGDGQRFVNLINQRGDEYATCNFDVNEGPSFTMRCLLGAHVQQVMGEKDSKWLPDYVLDVEAPEIYKGLKRVSRSLL